VLEAAEDFPKEIGCPRPRPSAPVRSPGPPSWRAGSPPIPCTSSWQSWHAMIQLVHWLMARPGPAVFSPKQHRQPCWKGAWAPHRRNSIATTANDSAAESGNGARKLTPTPVAPRGSGSPGANVHPPAPVRRLAPEMGSKAMAIQGQPTRTQVVVEGWACAGSLPSWPGGGGLWTALAGPSPGALPQNRSFCKAVRLGVSPSSGLFGIGQEWEYTPGHLHGIAAR